LGRNSGVEARFPINGYFAAPGMEITFDASKSVGAIITYEWDFDGDGTYDASTTEPICKHTYWDEFEGELALRVANAIGSTHVLRIPVRVSTKPYHQQLVPLKNVQAEALSTMTWPLTPGLSPSKACRLAASKRQHAPRRSPTSSGKKTCS
jgi:PKD domain